MRAGSELTLCQAGLSLPQGASAEQYDAVQAAEPVLGPRALLVTLALWRAARAAQCPVDEVEVDQALWWLGGPRHHELYADPLPDPHRLVETGILVSDLAGDSSLHNPGIQAARRVMQDTIAWAIAEQRPLADTPDGTVPAVAPVLVGACVRALRAPADPDTHPAIRYARTTMDLAEQRAGDSAEASAAERILAITVPALRARPHYPPVPQALPGSIAWLQRAHRLAHLAEVIHIAHHDPQVPDHSGWANTSRAVATALGELRHDVRDLDLQWAHRPDSQSLADWERAAIPQRLRRHITALEQLAAAFHAAVAQGAER